MKKLIILYGKFSDRMHQKQQSMIDGKTTCGYWSYAEKFGEIIYLAPQQCREKWEASICNPDALLEYLSTQPDAVVWSVKHDPEKDKILKLLDNKKLYYSCCSYNRHNRYADVSLVDVDSALGDGDNCRLWFKGKDENFWYPNTKVKEYDYCFVGKRGDKNEAWFINELASIKERRSIIWIGGKKHESKVSNSKHTLLLTEPCGPDRVHHYINKAKVGVILSDITAEGFPQSFVEMGMCGLPVAYMGPMNKFYNIDIFGYRIHHKYNAVDIAENLLSDYDNNIAVMCRSQAVGRFSLDASYEYMLELLDGC